MKDEFAGIKAALRYLVEKDKDEELKKTYEWLSRCKFSSKPGAHEEAMESAKKKVDKKYEKLLKGLE